MGDERRANPSAWHRPCSLDAETSTVSLPPFRRIRGVVRGLRVDEVLVTSSRVGEGIDGLRIVFASDIHAGRFLSRRRVGLVIDSINALDADVLVLGGDYVGGKAGGAKLFYPEVGRLTARLGIVAVLGNHDVWEGEKEARDGMAAAGIPLLDNESLAFDRGGSRLTVFGLEDTYTGRPNAAEALAGADPDAGFNLLLAHHPDALSNAIRSHPGVFDLAVAGHTHGGQVLLFGSWALHVPPRYRQAYVSGWRLEGGVPVLVSHGVGTVGLPLRIGAAPELHVITLKRA